MHPFPPRSPHAAPRLRHWAGRLLLAGAMPAAAAPEANASGVFPNAEGEVLSRSSSTAPLTGATQVRAVSVAAIKPFWAAHGIAFSQSTSAQLSAFQSPAARASTLAVGVPCGRPRPIDSQGLP